MNIFRRAAKAIGIGSYYSGGNLWGSNDFNWSRWPSATDQDFQSALEEAYRSSLVMDCIEFLVANGTSTPWMLTDAKGEQVEAHPALDMLNSPAPGDDASSLLSGIFTSLSLCGDAFAKIVPTLGGIPAELHYLPHTCIEIVPDRMGGILHYLYTPYGQGMRPVTIEVEEMLHIKRWKNWMYPFRGTPPIASLGPEIWLDIESTRFVSALMKNRGTPGGIIAPSNDEGPNMATEDLDTSREYMRTEFSGDKRGNWLVLGRAMSVTPFNFDPKMFDLKTVHDYCEERISSAFNFPAAVVGFGTGLEQTKVGATLSEQESQAWQGGIIPMQNLVARQITRQLLGAEKGLMLGFDRSAVPCLQEDEDAKATRWGGLVRDSVATVAEAREQFGLEAKDTDKVYLRAVSVVEIPWGVSQADIDAEAEERRREMEPEPEEEPEVVAVIAPEGDPNDDDDDGEEE